MDLVEPLKGWRRLQGRLRRASSWGGALLELEAAARALRAGADVVLSPPTVGARQADLAVTRSFPGGPITVYVEITGLATYSKTAKEALQMHDEIFPVLDLIGVDIEAGGRVMGRNPRVESRQCRQTGEGILGRNAGEPSTKAPNRRRCGRIVVRARTLDPTPGESRTIFSAPVQRQLLHQDFPVNS